MKNNLQDSNPPLPLASDLSFLSTLMSSSKNAGADRKFFEELVNDRLLFRRLVLLVLSPTKEDPLLAPAKKLQSALEKGVQCENGVYRFFDPGMSLEGLRTFYELQKITPMSQDDWYKDYEWARQEDVPQERTVRICKWPAYPRSYEGLPSARSIAMLHAVVRLTSTERDLGLTSEMLCREQDSKGEPILVAGNAWNEWVSVTTPSRIKKNSSTVPQTDLILMGIGN